MVWQDMGVASGSGPHSGILTPTFSNQITLLKYFRNYMSEHLLKAGANITPREGDELARLPYLRTWFRTRSAIILHLSNGTVQINFFQVCRGRGCSWGAWVGQECCPSQQLGCLPPLLPPPQAPAELFTHSLLPS